MILFYLLAYRTYNFNMIMKTELYIVVILTFGVGLKSSQGQSHFWKWYEMEMKIQQYNSFKGG